MPILRVRKLKLKRVSGNVLKVALLLVGPVMKPHDFGSYCHISVGSGLGGSDLEPIGLQEGREGTGHCARCLTYTVPGNPARLVFPPVYKWGHQNPDRLSDLPRSTWQTRARADSA